MHQIKTASLCGLGQGAPNPVETISATISAMNMKPISMKNAARQKFANRSFVTKSWKMLALAVLFAQETAPPMQLLANEDKPM